MLCASDARKVVVFLTDSSLFDAHAERVVEASVIHDCLDNLSPAFELSPSMSSSSSVPGCYGVSGPLAPGVEDGCLGN